MTLSDKLTRDQVRDAFNRNLTYADLEAIDIRALQGFIAIECASHDRKLASKANCSCSCSRLAARSTNRALLRQRNAQGFTKRSCALMAAIGKAAKRSASTATAS